VSAFGSKEGSRCLITPRTYRKREAGLPYRGWHYGFLSFARKYDVSFDWLLGGHGEMFNTARKWN